MFNKWILFSKTFQKLSKNFSSICYFIIFFYCFLNEEFGTEVVFHIVDFLPSMHKALDLTPSIT